MSAHPRLQKLTLVLGGAASGKSKYAESIIRQSGKNPVYLATSQPFDDEMQAKVTAHRQQRGDGWDTIEEPINISKVLDSVNETQAVLIDCATLWLGNLMHYDHDTDAAFDDLVAACRRCAAPVVIVSNELGMGLVPETSMGRKFRNLHGKMNQQIAAAADTVLFVAAGLPMTLKGAE